MRKNLTLKNRGREMGGIVKNFEIYQGNFRFKWEDKWWRIVSAKPASVTETTLTLESVV